MSRPSGEWQPTNVRTAVRPDRDVGSAAVTDHRIGDTIAGLSASTKFLVVVGILAVAVNLRSGVTSFGSVLGEFSRAWQLPGTVSGLLTALPVATFATVGLLAPVLARWFDSEPVVAAAMLASGIGLLARAYANSVPVFIACTVVALSGAAIGNVLLPPLVKHYFPNRIGLMTGLYNTALAIGMTGGASLTIPAEHHFWGGWRAGLGVWADVAAFAAIPWLVLCWSSLGPTAGPRPRHRSHRVPIHRSATARWLTLYFGCQSLNAYVVMGWLPSILTDAGFDARHASLALALANAMSIPMSMLIPLLAARRPTQYGLVCLTAGFYAAGYLGLMWSPKPGLWLCALLLGAANGSLPLAITMINLRSGRAELTAQLSAMTQCGGYLLAIAGPFLAGTLHQISGSWHLPLYAVLVAVAAQLVSGLRAAANRTVESELP
ncbi:MAG TPA: MFS transporter [Pseudonocardia sp.]|jgi:CP family cyanate transporter-like MFS transporter|nr:MFS transporter [Pseudonocardia sp.]